MISGCERAARGRWAEDLARRHLQSHGLELVNRNYRCRRGELDLVMRDGDTYVFVEVRYRHREDYGTGAESVDATKRRRLITAAKHYLQKNRLYDRFPCRFDVVAVTMSGHAPRVQWITHAFET